MEFAAKSSRQQVNIHKLRMDYLAPLKAGTVPSKRDKPRSSG